MSFIKKGLKKAWKFVKDNWMVIALVAATVFTAGVASVGFTAFAGVNSFGGFMGAVGSTMWSGATAIAGTFGIGEGGFGAAAAGEATAAGEAIIGTGAVGVDTGLAANAAMMPGMTANSASVLAGTAAPAASAGMPGVVGSTMGEVALAEGSTAIVPGISKVAPKVLPDVASKGLSLDTAMKYGAVIAPIAGAALAMAGQPSEFKNVDYYGTTKDGEVGPGRSALAVPGAGGGEGAIVGAGGGGSEAADGLMNAQQSRAQQSVMPGGLQRGTDGRVQTDALMGDWGEFANA